MTIVFQLLYNDKTILFWRLSLQNKEELKKASLKKIHTMFNLAVSVMIAYIRQEMYVSNDFISWSIFVIKGKIRYQDGTETLLYILWYFYVDLLTHAQQ